MMELGDFRIHRITTADLECGANIAHGGTSRTYDLREILSLTAELFYFFDVCWSCDRWPRPGISWSSASLGTLLRFLLIIGKFRQVAVDGLTTYLDFEFCSEAFDD